MSTLREAAIGAMGALETARNGLAWYRDRYPESTDGSDDEAAGDIDAAIDALRAELAKPDAPAAAPGGWQGLTEQERTKAVSAIEGYGTDFVAPIYAVIEGIERTLFERNTPRPAPAEPQGAEAPQEIKSLRDRIIEGELELDGTHPPTLMFLMAEHWKAVATEHYAKAKDYDRLKHELRLSRTAPAPPPAGGERKPAAQQEPLTVDYSGCDICARETATIAGFRLMVDPSLPPDVLVFRQGEREVGRIINAGITATKGER